MPYFDLSVPVPLLLARLACAITLGAIVAWRPLVRRPVKPDVRHALLIMTVAAAMVVVVIGDSMARAFGVVGLGSFIRFRSSIKDPRDAAGVGVVWILLIVLDRFDAPEPAPEPAPAPEVPRAVQPSLEFHGLGR
jgi:hypothetical protein